MRRVPVEKAVGLTLGHDITKIVPERQKYRAYRRGHVITAGDIPSFLDMGKKHIFVWEPDDKLVHEDEGALRLASAAAGNGLYFTEPSQGRVNLKSQYDGVLKVQTEQLNWINNIDNTIVAERPKLAPYIGGMKEKLADALETRIDRINIKATTTEGMGFCGREEGIGAFSVVSLESIGV